MEKPQSSQVPKVFWAPVTSAQTTAGLLPCIMFSSLSPTGLLNPPGQEPYLMFCKAPF